MTSVDTRTSAALGFLPQDVVDVIQTMRREHFRKSMTSYADHRVWQDVHIVPSDVGDLHVKFQAGTVSEFLLLSFKDESDG